RGAQRGTWPGRAARRPRLMVTFGEPGVKAAQGSGMLRADSPGHRILAPGMSRPSAQDRKELQAIARRSMTERGLEPDFPPAARVEADAITKPAADSSSSIKDLTGLLWASIDHDDSRDLS